MIGPDSARLLAEFAHKAGRENLPLEYVQRVISVVFRVQEMHAQTGERQAVYPDRVELRDVLASAETTVPR